MATHYDQIRNTFPVYSKFINSNLKSGLKYTLNRTKEHYK